MDKISEDIIKYLLDTDRVNGAFEKYRSFISPYIHKAAEGIKKFEVSSFTDLLALLIKYFFDLKII